jgi:hypothetical protein
MIAMILLALLISSIGLIGIVLPQTDSTPLVRGYEGGLVETDNRNSPKTGIAEGAIRMGIAVFRGTAGQQVRPPTAADAPALDRNGIFAALACTNAEQAFLAADADGVGGAGPWPIARMLTMYRSAHADADAVTTVLTYITEDGRLVTESHLAANGGGDTLTSNFAAKQYISWVVPAQQVGGGSSTEVGWSTLGGLTGFLGIAMRDVSGSYATDGIFADGDALSYLDEGTIWALPEDAVVQDTQVWVRVAAAGQGETYGRLGPDADGGDCVPLHGATWGADGDENAVVPVVLNK